MLTIAAVMPAQYTLFMDHKPMLYCLRTGIESGNKRMQFWRL